MKTSTALIIILVMYLVASELAYREQTAPKVRQQKSQTCGHLLATVFNGGALMDHASRVAYFFDKPVAVNLSN